MKKIIRLTERDLTRIVKRVLKEEENIVDPCETQVAELKKFNITPPPVCMTADGQDECFKQLTKMAADVTTLENILKIPSSIKNYIDCKNKNSQFSN